MRNKTVKKIVIAAIIIAAIGVFLLTKIRQPGADKEIIKEIRPVIGAIQNSVSATGTVLPKNRLEIKPPVNGRIDKVLVSEGENVKAGQVVAWMSSTERAALLDAARGQGEEELQYWREAYKAIPLISPIEGEVIVSTTQPGQTVTTGDPVIVLSDQLIVRAQVDETDIGKIEPGQKAVIALDAYPDTKIGAAVEHIYYESETVNNVTIYKVDLLPAEIPQFFRSGMNATIDFITDSKDNAMLVPLSAVFNEGGKDYVWVKSDNGHAPVKRAVEIGVTDEKNAEVVSGIDARDTVVMKTRRYSLPRNDIGSNPFMPQRQGR